MSRTTVIMCSRDVSATPDISASTGVLAPGVDARVVKVVGAPSMGAGYNLGVKEVLKNFADSEFLIFTHDDVTTLFGQSPWNSMLKAIEQPDVGFMGVAGATGLSQPLVWWRTPEHLPGCTLSGSITHIDNGLEHVLSFGPFGDVVVLDGVWLAIQTRKLSIIGPWREDGWHFYDIDMTLRAHWAGFRNVTMNLPLLHRSSGKPDAEWNKCRLQLCTEYARNLPVYRRNRL